MNETELNAINEKILLEINNTRKKIDEYSELCTHIHPENSIRRSTRMDAINNKSVIEATLRETKKKMHQL